MEILNYTEDHLRFRERVRNFFEKEVTPHVDEWEKSGITPKSIWKRMGEEGFLCTSVPKEYGGMGADFLYSVIVSEELVQTSHTGLAAPLHSDVVVPYITSFGSEELKRKYLPQCVSGDMISALAMTEPNAGSDLASIQTTAVEDGNDVVINGQKTFISNGINCDLLIIAARDPSTSDAYSGMDLYVVEAGAKGFEKSKKLAKMGWQSQDTAELAFTDCRIPKGNRLGTKGGGFLMLMEKLQQERLMVCIVAVAGAERMLRDTLRVCGEKVDFGKPITKLHNNRFKIVEMAAEVRLGRVFLDKLVADHLEGKSIVVDVSMAKFWTTEMAMRIADQCLELQGSYGYCEDNPMVRAWRDMRVLAIFAGTNEIMKGIAGKFMGL